MAELVAHARVLLVNTGKLFRGNESANANGDGRLGGKLFRTRSIGPKQSLRSRSTPCSMRQGDALCQGTRLGRDFGRNVAKAAWDRDNFLPHAVISAREATTAWEGTISRAKEARTGDELRRLRAEELVLADNSLGGVNSRRSKELRRCFARAEPNTAIIVEPPRGSHAIGFVMNLANICSSGDASIGPRATIAVPPGVQKSLCKLPRNEDRALYSLVLPYLMVAREYGKTDEVRRGVRGKRRGFGS